jgi:hydrogenase maturation protein HypF
MKTVKLPFRLKIPVLACGADMKGAFAFAKGDTAYLEDGFGDLADPDNLERYENTVSSLEKKLKIKPRVIVCDLHPGYFSTRLAIDLHRKTPGSKIYKVQHHEAHIASAMIDNAIRGDVIGVAFDGTGFGSDGNAWGGEFFVGNPKSFRRAAHFEYVTMPGGDAAVSEPWRMAASYLYKTFGSGFLKKSVNKERAFFIKTMIDKGVNSPLTSSAGRLFDAVASIVLEKDRADFEAQLPIELEKLARPDIDEQYSFDINSDSHFLGQPFLTLDASPVIKAIVKDKTMGTGVFTISAKFHNAMAQAIVAVTLRLRKKSGVNRVVFGGGVFQNKYLNAKASGELERKGFKVYRHRAINTNDSGIPIGQIAIARARGICV